MSTYATVTTYTHSVTYLAEKLLLSLKEIVRETGLDPTKLTDDWESIQRAITTWTKSRDLRAVHLEIYNPRTDTLVLRWDIDIEYGEEDEGTMWVDTEDLRYRIAKTGHAPRTCAYRVILSNRPGRPDVEGWSGCEFRPTDGMSRHAIGVMANAGSGLGASAAYWSKQ